MQEKDALLQSRSWAMCEFQHKTCLIKQARPIKLAPAARASCLLALLRLPSRALFRWNLTLFATILLTLQMKTQRGRGTLGQHRKALARFASRAWTAAPPPPSLRHRGSSELKILMFSFRQRLVEVESWFVTSSVAPAATRHPFSLAGCRSWQLRAPW